MKENNENGFKEGSIEYCSAKIKNSELTDLIKTINHEWDGYVAFSKGEKRLKEIGLAEISLSERVKGIENVEGYLMEIGAWHNEGDICTEICIEREDDGFFVQTWNLDTKGKGNCYYRRVQTVPRGNSLFIEDKLLTSYEVVVPKRRLHFFITVGGN